MLWSAAGVTQCKFLKVAETITAEYCQQINEIYGRLCQQPRLVNKRSLLLKYDRPYASHTNLDKNSTNEHQTSTLPTILLPGTFHQRITIFSSTFPLEKCEMNTNFQTDDISRFIDRWEKCIFKWYLLRLIKVLICKVMIYYR